MGLKIVKIGIFEKVNRKISNVKYGKSKKFWGKLENGVWHLFGSFRDRGLNGRNRRVSRVKFDQGAILRRPFEFCWRFSSRIAEKAIFWKSSFGTEVVRFGGKRSRIGLEFAPEACFCPRINLASSDFGFLN